MSSRNTFVPSLLAGLLAVGTIGVASVANAAGAGPLSLGPAKHTDNYVVEIGRRGGRDRGFIAPIAPSYLYYDYPYYYSRGFYPTHIKPGFIYYGRPYSYYKKYRRQRALKD
jgi:hypothetical protein